MSENSIDRVTVYKLKINDFDEVSLSNYGMVKDSQYTLNQKEYSYRLYFLKQFPKPAKWFEVFSVLEPDVINGKVPETLVAGFVLIVKIKESFYGITGGVGHIHLKKNTDIEHRFGIILAEKILSLPELKGLVQKDTSGVVNYLNRVFRGQYNPNGDINNLKRVLTNVRGKLRKKSEFYNSIGKSIQASDALSVNGSKTFEEMIIFLEKVDGLWTSDSKNISIPQLEHIGKKLDAELLSELQSQLIERLCNYSSENDINLFLDNESIGYLPDRVEKYDLIYNRQKTPCDTYEEVFERVGKILQTPDTEDQRKEAFGKMSLRVFFEDGNFETKELLYFICGDINYKNNVYFINNKLWYRASDEFVEKLGAEIDNIEFVDPTEVGLIEWDTNKYQGRQAEDNYNKDNSTFILLHCKLVKIQEERGGIEFCDLLKLEDNLVKIVHIKHGCGAALRALFAQGFVSAKLYSESSEFRNNIQNTSFTGVGGSLTQDVEQVLACLANTYKREMKIIFAIFDNKQTHTVDPNAKLTSEKLNGTLTTFAKVDLLERVNSIRSMGYGVAVTRIKPYP